MTLFSTLRERRDWSILQHPIDVQVDVLVVETEQVFNLRALGNRRHWARILTHNRTRFTANVISPSTCARPSALVIPEQKPWRSSPPWCANRQYIIYSDNAAGRPSLGRQLS
jgi:hypothetical protein